MCQIKLCICSNYFLDLLCLNCSCSEWNRWWGKVGNRLGTWLWKGCRWERQDCPTPTVRIQISCLTCWPILSRSGGNTHCLVLRRDSPLFGPHISCHRCKRLPLRQCLWNLGWPDGPRFPKRPLIRSNRLGWIRMWRTPSRGLGISGCWTQLHILQQGR